LLPPLRRQSVSESGSCGRYLGGHRRNRRSSVRPRPPCDRRRADGDNHARDTLRAHMGEEDPRAARHPRRLASRTCAQGSHALSFGRTDQHRVRPAAMPYKTDLTLGFIGLASKRMATLGELEMAIMEHAWANAPPM